MKLKKVVIWLVASNGKDILVFRQLYYYEQ